VLGVRSDLAGKLPKRLHIYAFGAALGGSAILTAAQNLAKKAGIPKRNLTLINRQDAYAHNDPNGAYPHNAFFAHLLPFLRKVAGRA
jgi:hypothetical protein